MDWISVDSGKPLDGQYVIAWDGNHWYECIYKKEEGFIYVAGNDLLTRITHWGVPTPPSE